MKKLTVKFILSALLIFTFAFSVFAISPSEARASTVGSTVTVTGFAYSSTDNPHIGFGNEFYLSDTKAQGILVETNGNTSVELYKEYSVTGTLSDINGELKITDATVTPLSGETTRKYLRRDPAEALDYSTNGGAYVRVPGVAGSPVTEDGMLTSFVVTKDNSSIKVVIGKNVLSLSDGENGKAQLTDVLQYRREVNVYGFVAKIGNETVIRVKDCDDIDVLEHNCKFGEAVTETAPSCGITGLSVKTCECGMRREESIPALTHSFYEVTEVTPSCTNSGLSVKKCKNCNFREETALPMKNHSYKEKTEKTATCYSEGIYVRYCENCTFREETAIPKKDHSYKERTEIEPSCTVEGLRVRYCSNCEFREETTLPMANHSYKEKTEKTATCYNEGIYVRYCETCTFREETVIPKKDHSYKERTEIEPSCTATGLRVRYCSNCEFREETTLPMANHSYKEKTEKTATCYNEGIYVRYCETCTFREETVIPKKDHSYKERTEVEPSCTATGLRVRYCSNCEFREETTLPMTNHSYKEKTEKTATCYNEGIHVRYCETCTFREETAIPKKDHSYKERTEVEPSCTVEGLRVRYCSNCEFREETTLPMTNHRYKEKTEKTATCYNEGIYVRYCETCTFREETAIPKKDHSYKERTEIEPSCTVEGLRVRYCSNCEFREETTLPMINHSYKEKTEKVATCYSEGIYVHYCETCTFRKETVIPKKEHTYKEKTEVEATCLADGKKTLYCSGCDFTEEIIIPKGEHKFEETVEAEATCVAEGVVKRYCTTCDFSEKTTLPKTVHSYKETTEKKATCTEEGLLLKVCKNCGDNIQTAIPKIQHVYISDVTKASFSHDGRIADKCKNCGDEKNPVVIPAVTEYTLSKESFVYNGKAQAPTVTLKDKNGKAVTDFTFICDTAKEIGKYSVSIELKGNYSGKKTLYFTIIPKDVTNLKAIVISDQATITFDEIKGADGYRVYYQKGTKLKSLGTSTKPSCSISLPECGKTYTIIIKAYKKQGDTTLWSKGVSAKISSGPEAVTGIKESCNFYAIKLTWDKGDSAEGYRVYIRKSDGTFKILTTTTKTSYTVIGLSGGTKYTFAFKAYRKVDGKTIWGKTVKKTAETSSAKPSSFSAKEGTYEVTLSWREVKGAKGYKVYRYDSKKKKYITVATVKENSYTVENLSSGTTYKFAVKAYAEKDKKTYYGEAVYLTVTTKLKKPTLTVKVTSKGNALSWKAVGGADSYEIYRSYEKDGKYTKIKTTSNLNFTDTSANKNKTCYYKIRACKTVSGTTIKSSFTTVKKASR